MRRIRDTVNRWLLAALIVLVVLAAPGLIGTAEAGTLGLHIGSVHSTSTYYTRHPLLDRDTLEQIGTVDRAHRFERFNPGVYRIWDNGATAGVFRNSYGRVSAYAGMTWETRGRTLALTVGGVTGYPGVAVAPLVAPSLRLALPEGYAARLTLLPKPPTRNGTAALHFSVERSF